MSSEPVSHVQIKPTQKVIADYYAELRDFAKRGETNETTIRVAFQHLLEKTARERKWTLLTEHHLKVKGREIILDGALVDEYNQRRAYWEAKDAKDDLDREIANKRADGYPLTNIIFENSRRAVLYQDGREVMSTDITIPENLANLLTQFLRYSEPNIEEFHRAMDEFRVKVPELAAVLLGIIRNAHTDNRAFQDAFADFFRLCQTSLNPNMSEATVDEMLVQHLLTERIMSTVFDYSDFREKNVVAAEVEKVISALASKSFSRSDFLKSLDRFYIAIENAARTVNDFTEKQHFINTVYERFFQGYSVKIADTHGIVYTPQPIVDFMCASVEQVLKDEFGLSLGSPGVQILDPCTGTGSFIVNLLGRIPPTDLKRVYREQLFANEIMLLPYYIASLNIEHRYYELSGEYEPFEGLCFVDTLELAEAKQRSLFVEKNTERVDREKEAPITVVIGNPPYNVGQENENDNNKNRPYPVIEKEIRDTYAKDSTATNRNALSDAYVKFFRWATDRLEGRDGVVCFVSNNSFVDQIAFDGMRKHLLKDFTHIWHIDLHGNVRKNPKLSGTTHNVFGIQVGVGITIAVRHVGADRVHGAHERVRPPTDADVGTDSGTYANAGDHGGSPLRYFRVPEDWRKEEKWAYLTKCGTYAGVPWQELMPDERNTWLVPENADEYASFVPMGNKEAKAQVAGRGGSRTAPTAEPTIFDLFSNGVKTNRDDVVYDFHRPALVERVKRFIDDYNGEVGRWAHTEDKSDVDAFVSYDRVNWSRDLKLDLQREHYAKFEESKVRASLYRPFCRRYLFFDRILNEEVYVFPHIFPTPETESENRAICASAVGNSKSFHCLMSGVIPDLHLTGDSQCFPFYVYDEDGSNRRENVTDWAVNAFRAHYGDESISKWDIFHYVYAVLHHPVYREKFADNLKRELPRVPLVSLIPPCPLPRVVEGGGPAVVEGGGPAFSPLPSGEGKASATAEEGVRETREQNDSSNIPSSPFYPREKGMAAQQSGDEGNRADVAGVASLTPLSRCESVPSPSGRGERPYPPSSTAGRRASCAERGRDEGVKRNPPISEAILEVARRLRKEATGAEAFLWELLRDRRFLGAKFRRQHVFGPFVLDFYCDEAKLGIELDGGVHDKAEQARRDRDRTMLLENEGIRVVRFRNEEVLNDTERVLGEIGELLPLALTPSPSPGGRGEQPFLPSSIPGRRGDGGDEGASVFRLLVRAGERLADLHVNYETVEPWPLEAVCTATPLSYRVEKMRLSKDRTELVVNDTLTLRGIPPEVFEYRLGNRSALDWVIDQYQVTTDRRSGITSDPNRLEDEEYIVNLVKRVVRVSMETIQVVKEIAKVPLQMNVSV